jgi:hypothetical protein
MNEIERFKYLGVALNKYGQSDEVITLRIKKGGNCIGALNSLLWSKNTTRNTKKLLFSAIFKSIILYGSEVWEMKDIKQKLLAV